MALAAPTTTTHPASTVQEAHKAPLAINGSKRIKVLPQVRSGLSTSSKLGESGSTSKSY